MTTTITPASKMYTLVRREYQEQRILFVYLPVLVVLGVTVAYTVAAIRFYIMDIRLIGLIGNTVAAESPDTAINGFVFSAMDEKIRFWEQFYGQFFPILAICFWGSLFYYFLMTLYSQRRDRSVLFWHTLPVTDTETILSKLAAGFVLCHAIYLVCLFVMQIMMMLVMMGYTAMFDISVWDNVVRPSRILSRYAGQVGFSIIAVFWCLPVYAWLLLTSAWARSAPFAWAMAPLVLFTIFELIFFGSGDVVRVFMEHTVPIVNLGVSPAGSIDGVNKLFSVEMLLSILLGIAFLVGAIRFNRSEDL